MSQMYGFILNMWIMNKVDENYVEAQCNRGRLTDQERDMILSTPKL